MDCYIKRMFKMKLIFALIFLIFCTTAKSIDYQIDLNTNHISYGWYANEVDNALYRNTMTGIGVTALYDNGFGLRVGYMKGDEARTQGYYHSRVVDMKSITSFEVLYKKEVFENIDLYGGFGTYLIPVPMTSVEEGYFRDDRDDDEGYFYGVSIRLYNNVLLNYRRTKYSSIISNGSDEWIKGNSIQLVYQL